MDSSHKGKKLIDGMAVGESPAVAHPASDWDPVVVRACMEYAEASRQTMQAAGKLLEELLASSGEGGTQLEMIGRHAIHRR